ncbi:MAG TPA: LamG-like jellyroll fold domain-containing protein [Gaiellaceae bacterium]|nr:LamG-like jellyroll fold domain-containing protein [Gaiellaceae bacterium]
MRARVTAVRAVPSRTVLLVATFVALTVLLVARSSTAEGAVPTGFQETVVFSGLTNPTAVRFASDGRVFVAEKSGIIKVFDGLSDSTPTVFADLHTNVHNFWDRGLLGLALDPNFPTTPFVYVLYTYDKEPGNAQVPRWGTTTSISDGCPTPPGATGDGCVVSGRLSRLQANGNVAGPEQPLIDDWCQQYPSHSIGSLAFGADGALYVSGGDGASFNFADWGQDGAPLNPCGDPPGGVGATLTPPTAEGGALRSQDLRTTTDPTSLNGAILRLNPATGAAMPDNPLAGSSDVNASRIVAHGLRNPFRITTRPGTSEVWVGDVGWNDWEEINRVTTPTIGVLNFGWPCYEGAGRQGGYDGANLNICENLYTQANAHTGPYYTYNHAAKVVAGETCPSGSSSISGLAFYTGGAYPDVYDGALFFADYSRDCIWAMRAGGNGLPSTSAIETFVAAATNPVDLQRGPGGDLFYVDLDGGTIRRISYPPGNGAPTALATATPQSGAAPLNVQFDGTGSTDPNGDPLTYAWDLDGDGLFDDSTSAAPSWTYTQAGTVNAALRVTDGLGASDTDTVVITVSGTPNTPPSVTISSPSSSLLWSVGDVVSFAGSATDAQDGALPASALSWRLVMQHCPSNCHSHVLQDYPGVASGSFVAPDHEYPSYLELTLTAADSGGSTASQTVRLDPRTVNLTFASSPSGLQLTVGPTTAVAPFTRTVIVGSSNSVSAPTPQTLSGTSYGFASWSDGGAQSHNVVAPATQTTYTATYAPVPPSAGLVAAYSFDAGSGSTLADLSGTGNNGAISGATWSTQGRYGGALSFDGVNDLVTIADAPSLDLTTGMTLEAWARPTTVTNWRTVLLKEQPAQLIYALYANNTGNRPSAHVFVGADQELRGTARLTANVWTHLAATYDGATLRIFVDGTQAATLAVSGSILTSNNPLRIGGNSIWSEWFGGLIDDVRIYNRPLTQAQIQSDMNTPVGPPQPGDLSPPTAPGTPSVTTAIGQANLSWTAATDNVGVVRYNVHRSTTSGFTPSLSNRVAQPTGTSYSDTGLAGGTYYYKVTAEDAAGNVGSPSGQAQANVPADSPPTAPTGLSAATAIGTASLTWSVAIDDVAVVRYNVHRSTVAGFTPALANRIAQPTGTTYVDSGLAGGTYYYKVTAEDTVGQVGPASNQATANVPPDLPPTVSVTAPAGGATVSGTITVTANASDDVQVSGVQFRVDGANLGAEDTSPPYSASWATTGVANGSHTLTAVARDSAGQTTTSAAVTVTVSNATPPPPTGLAAAYSFNAGSGSSVTDASGNGNAGAISGAAWSTQGKYGSALSFDGVNDLVTVPDANSLDFTSSLTIEAWVFPTDTSSWHTVVLKEQPGQLVYALYASTDTPGPGGHVFVNGDTWARGPSALPLNTWTHLAVTYDGSTIRLYIGGALAASLGSVVGSMPNSTLPLDIGGNNVWGEWFAGRIDEVRIYNRALSQTELQTDMNTPIG